MPEQYVSLPAFCSRSGTWARQPPTVHRAQGIQQQVTYGVMHDGKLQLFSNGAVLKVKTLSGLSPILFFRLQKLDQRRHRALDVLAHYRLGPVDIA